MIRIPKGTKDVLPSESYKWHYIESMIRQVVKEYNLSEIRTPTFEATELFMRGVGSTTDIVNKEMYTFEDKGNRSITLKPEGTAGVARAVVENSLYMEQLPLKMYYITPVFRYERPQSGRLREHHQFGVELYGADTPIADAEVIMIAKSLLNKLNITDLQLYINSIGCEKCRKDYNLALKSYLKANLDKMCSLCRDRFDKNPLRILDCKEKECIEINKKSPKIQDYLCEGCKSHQNGLIAILEKIGINYSINPMIVRGLDYYTKTVFEFVSTNIGAQGTVCGGGRYNNLTKEVGGKQCSAVGFGMGIERLIMVIEELNLSFGEEPSADIYILPFKETQLEAYYIANDLREKGFSAEIDLIERGLKPQMRYANKIKAKNLVVIGEDELRSGKCKIKRMDTGEENEININDIHLNIKR